PRTTWERWVQEVDLGLVCLLKQNSISRKSINLQETKMEVEVWEELSLPRLEWCWLEKSLVPEPVEWVPSPLPLPPIATATISVPLNRFLLHVNTYYRSLNDF
ncbi:hypothetical protein E2I00_009584, partial [Balaenoptera physalus]